MNQINSYITELTWDEIAKEVDAVNSELATLINELSPDKSYKLYRVRYKYGSEALHEGILHLPNEQGDMQSIHDIDLPKTFKDDLLYNFGSNPTSLILKNTFEMYLPLSDRIIPLYGLMPTGKLFGTWWVLSNQQSYQPTFSWHMSAGTRSTFMLPKVSNKANHQKLQKMFGFRTEAPAQIIDQWNVFRQIANHPQYGEPWEAEVLYFSGEWFKHLDDVHWAKFKNHLFQEAWDTSDYWRYQFIDNLLYSFIQSQRGIRFTPFALDTLKHLLAIAMGVYQGFFPAQDELAIPYRRIQDAYVNIYQLNPLIPTVMVPKIFNLKDPSLHSVAYYSLNYPTAPAFSPKNQQNSSMISDLQEVKATYERYIKGLELCKVQLEPSKLAEVVKRTLFNYIHSDAGEQHTDIQLSDVVSQLDPIFADANGYPKNTEFAKNSPFFKGCIRISLKNE